MYEELCLYSEHHLRNIFQWLGVEQPPIRQARITRSSRSSRQSPSYASTLARLESWKQKLSNEDQRRILQWAHRLGIDMYDEHVLQRTVRG